MIKEAHEIASFPDAEQQRRTEITWKYLYQIALRHKRELVIAHIIALLATLASVPVPLLMPLLVDEVLLNNPGMVVETINAVFPVGWQGAMLYILTILLVTLLLRLLALVFNVVQARQFTYISKDIIYRIRSSLIRRLQKISMAEYETLGGGTVVTYLVTDIDTLDVFIGSTVSRLLVATLSVIGTAVVLMWIHWQLALFILFLNPIVIYFTKILGRSVKDLKKKENSAFELFQQALTETLEAIHQIRASNRERYYLGQLIDSARSVKQHSAAFSWKSDTANRLSFLVFLFGFDVFRATAMFMVIFSDLSIGQMLAVFGYLWFMMAPVQEILGIQYAFYGARAALERLGRLENLRQEPKYPHLRNPFAKAHTVGLQLDDLHFSYGGDNVLNGITLDINPGEKVALVGASGGGKSTLVQVLIGLYPATSGSVRFDGVAITEIGLEVVREHVVTVLQHPVLFNDTVRSNLTLGQAHTEQELWKALEIAQLKTTIAELPKALETLVGRGGMRLSGGQRQRMAIARMVLARPKVVILDEATSALDAETEYRLYLALAEFLENRTTIIVAHRLSAVKQADRVFVFEDGRICEQGEHHVLIKQNGLYAKLYGDKQTASPEFLHPSKNYERNDTSINP